MPSVFDPNRTAQMIATCLLVALMCAPAVAHGDDDDEPGPDKVEYHFEGHARFRTTALSAFPLDTTGLQHGHNLFGRALVELAPEVSYGDLVKIRASIVLLDGQFFGDTSDIGHDVIHHEAWRNESLLDQIALHEAWVQVPVYIGVLRVGRMLSQWGLGMVAHHGHEADYMFADGTHPDVVNRAMFITKPLQPFDLGVASDALVFVIGGDLVEEDELTDRHDGDLAWQFVTALAWRQPTYEAGMYVAYRDLSRENGAYIRATAIDSYGRWEHTFGDRLHLKLEAEVALIIGATNEVQFEVAPDEVAVNQVGGVVRATLEDRGTGIDYGLEVGVASGDNDPQDGTLRSFRFDPGYKVGMILFEEVLNRASARSYDRVTDPNLVGEPPKGSERIATQGSITNAIYLNPTVHSTWFDGMFHASAGLLVAFAAGDVTDPYASAQSGGYNRNAWGKRNAFGPLGYELNTALDVRVGGDDDLLQFRVGAQYGVFVPGSALQPAAGGPGLGVIHKLRLLTDVTW